MQPTLALGTARYYRRPASMDTLLLRTSRYYGNPRITAPRYNGHPGITDTGGITDNPELRDMIAKNNGTKWSTIHGVLGE